MSPHLFSVGESVCLRSDPEKKSYTITDIFTDCHGTECCWITGKFEDIEITFNVEWYCLELIEIDFEQNLRSELQKEWL